MANWDGTGIARNTIPGYSVFLAIPVSQWPSPIVPSQLVSVPVPWEGRVSRCTGPRQRRHESACGYAAAGPGRAPAGDSDDD
jgi:hypothetical protein